MKIGDFYREFNDFLAPDALTGMTVPAASGGLLRLILPRNGARWEIFNAPELWDILVEVEVFVPLLLIWAMSDRTSSWKDRYCASSMRARQPA
jgi:hypothetical protein